MAHEIHHAPGPANQFVHSIVVLGIFALLAGLRSHQLGVCRNRALDRRKSISGTIRFTAYKSCAHNIRIICIGALR